MSEYDVYMEGDGWHAYRDPHFERWHKTLCGNCSSVALWFRYSHTLERTTYCGACWGLFLVGEAMAR